MNATYKTTITLADFDAAPADTMVGAIMGKEITSITRGARSLDLRGKFQLVKSNGDEVFRADVMRLPLNAPIPSGTTAFGFKVWCRKTGYELEEMGDLS